MEESGDGDARPKRTPRPTIKVMEQRLNTVLASRKAKFGLLSQKMTEIDALMEDEDNAGIVSQKLSTEFTEVYMDFCKLNDTAKEYMSEQDMIKDQTTWYESRSKELKDFVVEVENWLQRSAEQAEEARLCDADVCPADSASMVRSAHKSGNVSHTRPSSVVSTTSSARLRYEAERAALIAQASALKQKQEIDREVAQLKAKKEELEIKTAIAAANAKLEVLGLHDSEEQEQRVVNDVSSLHAGAAIAGVEMENVVTPVQPTPQEPVYQRRHLSSSRPSRQSVYRNVLPPPRPHAASGQAAGRQHGPMDIRDLLGVMQHQNDITELLVQQQRLSSLPSVEIPVFSGDPVEYRFFTKAFEHGIEDRTSSSKDCLYFLEQYTSGQPKVLVRSCQHMPPDVGYQEAKRLLYQHYGNEYTIAMAYVEKALKWPILKAEDKESLTAFAVFLTSCLNTVEGMEFREEMDSPTNMRAVIAKLPFRLRERWRSIACEIQDKTGRRARFKDLVYFVDRQARIASDPLFGNIQEPVVSKDKGMAKAGYQQKTKGKKSAFATSAAPVTESKEAPSTPKEVLSTSGEKCHFCQKEHKLVSCKAIEQKPHKERLEFLKSKGLCFGCLLPGHMSKSCQKKLECQKCSLKHPTILHFASKPAEKTEQDQDKTLIENKLPSMDNQICGCTRAGDAECALAVVPVKVKSLKGNHVVQTYAFLDPGSSACFCSEDLMHDLKVTGRKTHILLRTMGQERPVSTNVVTGLEICGLEGDSYVTLPQVFSQKEIPVKKESIPRQKDIDGWPYLKEIRVREIEADIGLLIGTNVPKALEPWKVINSKGNGPYAIKTVLGWVINGPLQKESVAKNEPEWTQVAVNRISVACLEDVMLRQMKLDFPEAQQAEKVEMSVEDGRFMDSVSMSVQLVDGHYSIGLPLKEVDVKFPNNRVIAVQRAENLRRKFIRSEEFYQDYVKFMNDMLERGYAEKIPEDEVHNNEDEGRTWYIPHHGVYHPTKHKIRVVFDCAAKFQGISLNSQLLQGPDLTNSLIGVLLRFRQEPVAFMSDIEGMFHQVRVPAKDTNLLRFLWWPQGNHKQELEEYRMVVHLFGATSSPSCANFALRRCAENHQERFSPEASQTVMRNFYVDDCLKSVESEDKAVALIQEVRALCALGGFKVTKWISNSRTVLASVPEDERATGVKDLDLDKDLLPIERALGVQWCVESDVLKFRVTIQKKVLTRRGLLSMVSSVYDPLGILSPIILPVKGILQELCMRKHGWDDDMPDSLVMQWEHWMAGLHQLSDLEVKRCVKAHDLGRATSARLHHFADASEKGYGVCTYLVLKNEKHQAHCAFIMGKARVAPLKTVTIPRLELTAATVAAKMDKMVQAELDMDLEESVFWSDSTTVLRYIRNESARYRTFVANRITAIREQSRVSQWRYVGSSSNPADHASRGCTVEAFLKASEWLSGPEFLLRPEDAWPDLPDGISQPLVNDLEVKEAAVFTVVSENTEDTVLKFIHHYSSWYRLKRAVAWLVKFKNTLKLLSQRRKEFLSTLEEKSLDHGRNKRELERKMAEVKASLRVSPPSLHDVWEAELEIVRISQRTAFSNEIAMLEQGKLVSKSSPLYRLSPVLQDNIVRVGGRLNRAVMPEESKNPAILAKGMHIAPLILREIHEEVGHNGRNHMLSKLRQKFWIPKPHVVIRKILSQCVTCRRLHGAASGQIMADLPKERILPDEPPFTSVGVDYFGPFDIKRGRTSLKRYGVIFTCLAVRAVHIEVASSLDTDSCIHALRRFVARRGQVSVIRSDNGTNFVGAERELRQAIQALDKERIEAEMMQKNIRWIFNPPSASHHGGVWERQIRSVRKILNSVVKQQTLDEEGLQTLMCEVEAIINSRPLTRVSDDPNDLEPLTPNHLLLLKTKPLIPPGVFDQKDTYSRRRWRQVQYMAELFWKRWTKEYLPDLQQRQKWLQPRRNVAVNDIVLVIDDSAPRSSWIMGRVIETIADSKGRVRQVQVKTSTNVLLRPITKLCLLLEADM